jgi:hypothetical protein
MEDIPAFDRAKAESEVDKFLMDAEMVNLYIQFGKEVEKNPDFKVPEAEQQDEGFFSLRTLVLGYVTYVFASTGITVFRRYVAGQEVAGDWKGTNIPFIDQWIERTSPEETAKVLQKLSEAADSAAAQSAESLQTAADAVQAALQ